jgi:hypothetical protein
MKNIICYIIIALFFTSVIYSSEQSIRKNESSDYIEIHFSASGGMRQIIYEKHYFIFIESIEKQDQIVVSTNDSFVEIQKKTNLSKDQERKLHNWIKKYDITNIKLVPKAEKEDMGALRYPSHLMIFINSKEYNLDHYTIIANTKLQQAFDELYAMAKEFTTTINEK